MTAVAAPPRTEQPKPDKNRKVRFEASGNGLSLVVEPQDQRINALGKIVPIQGTGTRIEFKPVTPQKQAYETRDPDEIEYLRNHTLFHTRTFVEVPIAKPPSSPVIAEIAQLGVDHDVESIVRIYEEEEAGWERDDVLEACKDTLVRIEAARERLRTQQAASGNPA